LRVVTHSLPHLETVSLGVWINAGARHEQVDQHGIAHFLEHMAFKGTPTRTALEIAEEIEMSGGDLNAATSLETTAYYARVLKGDTGLAVSLLSDILINPSFADEEMERERDVIIQEIGHSQDTPDDLVFDLFQQTSFPDQPLGRPILGTVETVSEFVSDDLRVYRDHFYQPSAMVVAAVGAADHATLLDQVKDTFGAMQEKSHETPKPATYIGGNVQLERDIEQLHVIFGLKSIAINHPDFYAMQILSYILGGGMSSRLFQEVREKRGLCYSVFSFNWGFSDTGVFGIYAGTGPQKAQELGHVIVEELKRLSATIKTDELSRAKAQLKAGLVMCLEQSSSRAEQIARQMLLFGRVIPIQELIDKVEDVDIATLARLAEDLVQQKNPTIALIGPGSGLASFDNIRAKFE
jgi:predicted Zn-dependent peptidase